MYLLPQQSYFSFVPSRSHGCLLLVLCRPSVHCFATTSAARQSALTLLGNPSLQSTWSHRVWLTFGCATVALPLGKSAMMVVASSDIVELGIVVAGLVGYVLVNLSSGVYHWGIDNYGDVPMPVFGSQIQAFRGHHKWPWTITRRQVANNLHAVARTVAFPLLPFDLFCDDATVLCFTGSFAFFIMTSQQFHLWAYCTKSGLPLLLSWCCRTRGCLYHGCSCIVSGAWNRFLDENRVFEALEMAIYFHYGLRPRSWSEPVSEWTKEADENGNGSSPEVAAQA